MTAALAYCAGVASPEMEATLALMRRRQSEQLGAEGSTLEERRAVLEAMGSLFALPDDVAVTEVWPGGVPGVLLAPPGVRTDAALLYLHGGGYQLGSTVSHRELAARLARSTGVRALAVDYRLAPEHPFPAAVDDALAAYRWLLEDQGLASGSVVLAGDSAGGGLAVALLVAARASGSALPAAAALLSPWLDLTGSGATMVTKADADPILSAAVLDEMAAAYAGGVDRSDPLASPLFADLGGLPPLMVDVGTEELLMDDGVRFCDAAAEAGVDVTLTVAEGMPHVWHFIAVAPEATAATDRLGTFLAGHLR